VLLWAAAVNVAHSSLFVKQVNPLNWLCALIATFGLAGLDSFVGPNPRQYELERA